ncbi:hypothetical protein Ahy_B08g089469 [Arachis hypogaea]|uniref:Uncharacterized protein n=1 Tax=Arachis hypogaea TaxID=3818 RepID=A0A444XXY3_ARAHY|nr:hypothetical protein Ahy_B08g089469 [Arachis hypogaea]
MTYHLQNEDEALHPPPPPANSAAGTGKNTASFRNLGIGENTHLIEIISKSLRGCFQTAI